MARPTRQGVDYFPLDVHLDNKFKFITIKFGLEGFGTILTLFQEIYANSYWCKWTEDEQLIFEHENNISKDRLSEIVEEALERNIFNRELYEKYEILTSSGIQKRYMEIVKRRKYVHIIEEYLLIDNVFKENTDTMQTDSKHDVSMMSTPSKHDVNKSTQSKVKESKVKESNIVGQKPSFASERKEVIDYLNKKLGSKYKPNSSKAVTHINARLNEGYTLSDFRTVIDNKARDWIDDPKMKVFLRPETLFGTKFEGYLNQRTDHEKDKDHNYYQAFDFSQ